MLVRGDPTVRRESASNVLPDVGVPLRRADRVALANDLAEVRGQAILQRDATQVVFDQPCACFQRLLPGNARSFSQPMDDGEVPGKESASGLVQITSSDDQPDGLLSLALTAPHGALAHIAHA